MKPSLDFTAERVPMTYVGLFWSWRKSQEFRVHSCWSRRYAPSRWKIPRDDRGSSITLYWPCALARCEEPALGLFSGQRFNVSTHGTRLRGAIQRQPGLEGIVRTEVSKSP